MAYCKQRNSTSISRQKGAAKRPGDRCPEHWLRRSRTWVPIACPAWSDDWQTARKMDVAIYRKMKVHPGILMKTKKGRFQVSGLRCQAPEPMMSRRTEFRLPAAAAAVTSKLHEHRRGNMSKNEGSSGDVDENKERQVSGLRCRVSGPGTHDVAENGVSTSSRGCGSYEQIARTPARKCIEK